MKTVYATNEIYHLFIHEFDKQDFKNPQRNLFSENNILYSYGYHYSLCKVVEPTKGSNKERVYLVNKHTYSSTTNKHRHGIIQAIPDYYKSFQVDDPDNSSLYNFDCMLDCIKFKYFEMLDSKRKIKIDRLQLEIYKDVETLKDFESTFKIKRGRLSGIDRIVYNFKVTDIETLKAEKEKQDKKVEAKQRKLNKELEKEYFEGVEKWENQETNILRIPIGFTSNLYHFRLSKCGNYIETSHGAKMRLKNSI